MGGRIPMILVPTFEKLKQTKEDLTRQREWIILRNGFRYGELSWPDSEEGRHQAELVARALEAEYDSGVRHTQANIRQVLGVFSMEGPDA